MICRRGNVEIELLRERLICERRHGKQRLVEEIGSLLLGSRGLSVGDDEVGEEEEKGCHECR